MAAGILSVGSAGVADNRVWRTGIFVFCFGVGGFLGPKSFGVQRFDLVAPVGVPLLATLLAHFVVSPRGKPLRIQAAVTLAGDKTRVHFGHSSLIPTGFAIRLCQLTGYEQLPLL